MISSFKRLHTIFFTIYSLFRPLDFTPISRVYVRPIDLRPGKLPSSLMLDRVGNNDQSIIIRTSRIKSVLEICMPCHLSIYTNVGCIVYLRYTYVRNGFCKRKKGRFSRRSSDFAVVFSNVRNNTVKVV